MGSEKESHGQEGSISDYTQEQVTTAGTWDAAALGPHGKCVTHLGAVPSSRRNPPISAHQVSIVALEQEHRPCGRKASVCLGR